ncbi:dynactin subunit 4 [Anomaloglossus baeobatrachus]|uniref:dynactin subunit 4 n=1 Tax=Anomaloglossus baeobatrachus TaxID=238106 RepID=UPI003F4F48C6
MASLLQLERVLYLVHGEKEIRAPLSQLYFCRYCSELRSLECVSHEVDSHYCPSCLENMPSAEAKLKKNRCANCFDCPCCMHTLSTRATSIPAPLPDDPAKTTMKKAYYLACGFCRWTSRDVGMADKSVASGGWQEPENPHNQRINKLLEYYQQLAQKEKIERDRKKLVRRRNYMPLAFSQHTIHVADKYGRGTRLQRQRPGVPITPLAGLTLKEGEDQKEIKIEPAQALEEVEPLPEDYYTRPINLTEARHYYDRTDYSILLQESQVLLTLTNPVESLTHLMLMPCEDGDPHDINSTAKVIVPTKELVLAGKDATAEYDELAEPANFQDDPDVVAFRKANKVGVFIKVTPLQEKGKVIVSFKLKHDFRNQPTPIRPTEDNESGCEAVWLSHHVELDLGPVVPAAP